MAKQGRGGNAPRDNGNRNAQRGQIRKGGYQPLNEGHKPDATKGHSAAKPLSQQLPKAPEGGTGATPPATSPASGKDKD
jgi:hypothetical protein